MHAESTLAPCPAGKAGLVERSRRSDFLLFSTPAVGQEEIDAVADALRSGWITTGPKTRNFERAFQELVEAPDALGLNSCTAGLHVGLIALGVRPGDEVITTPLTFCACANVIEHLGATPRFVDVEPDTLNLDPNAIEAAVTSRTRAILAVHYAGHPVDLDPIHDIANRRGLGLIEDAAHALPARYKGRSIGSGSNPVSFSFYATKNLTTGEGGMLTGTPDLLARARTLGLHGMSRDAWKRYGPGGSWFYNVDEPGFKYNMTDIQASIGLAQLAKLERFQQRRREIVGRYTAAFEEIEALQVPVERSEVEHAWHLYVLRLRPEALRITREQFIDELTARNIGCSVHFIPIHLHPYYRQKYHYTPTAFPVAVSNYRRMLSLPLHPMLTDGDVDDVITAVLDIVARFAR
ncbi:MAG TPA: DegT/DnrJ/EryC1/StrS family aminotransferase [Gemmatimonadales bacterium]|nr:DegT/DnrJ/EryC1/StrS family aminotransferase [Gemmatimonadales bacterium]